MTEKTRKIINKKWYWIGGAVALVVIAFIFAGMWSQNRSNPFLAFLFVANIFGAFYLYYRSRQTEEGGLTLDGAKVENANCVNFYPGHFEFAFMAKKDLLGLPKQFTNDGKWYHVHKWNEQKRCFEEYTLPDKCVYYDTKEYANVHVLRAHQRLAIRKAGTMQKVAPVLLGVVDCIVLFILFAMSGG